MNLLQTPGAIELPYQDISIMFINLYNINMCLAKALSCFPSYGCCVCSRNCLNIYVKKRRRNCLNKALCCICTILWFADSLKV
jgi:hypothetical protein